MGDGMSKVVEYSHEEEGGLEESPLSDGSCESQRDYGCYPGAPGADTLIIFDWDDTLLCSSALNMGRWSAAQLELLERTAEASLRMAMRLGDTVIVTNGNANWVQDSAARFLPGLRPLLDRMEVTSARADYEHHFPGDPIMWKRMAFKELLARRQREREENFGPCKGSVNLIVIGDSPAEIEAAYSSVKILSGTPLVKTVKLKECPSVPELIGQLKRVTQELGRIVREDRSQGRGLVQRPLPGPMGQMASWASGWRTVSCR